MTDHCCRKLPIASSLRSPGNVLGLIDRARGRLTAESRAWFARAGYADTPDPDILFSPEFNVWLVFRRTKLRRKHLGFSPSWMAHFRGVYVVWRLPLEVEGRVRYERTVFQVERRAGSSDRVLFRLPSRYAPDTIMFRNAFKGRLN